MTTNNTDNVNQIIEKSENNNTNINDVINIDLNKQQDDFKKKLLEKRRKTAKSDIGDNISINFPVIQYIK